MFRRRFGRRFPVRRFRKRRTFKLPTKLGHVNILGQTLSQVALTDTFTLIATADSPDATLETDGTNNIQVENDSLVWGKLKIDFAVNSGSIAVPVDVLVFKDINLGSFTAPTDADGWALAPNTDAIALQKKAKIYFKRFMLSPQADKMTLSIRIKPKLLRDGESIGILIEDRNANTHTINYQIYGGIKHRQV